eukprot:scaffold297105_cov21-Tisochrysis_lutea.AAC.2
MGCPGVMHYLGRSYWPQCYPPGKPGRDEPVDFGEGEFRGLALLSKSCQPKCYPPGCAGMWRCFGKPSASHLPLIGHMTCLPLKACSLASTLLSIVLAACLGNDLLDVSSGKPNGGTCAQAATKVRTLMSCRKSATWMFIVEVHVVLLRIYASR